MKLINVQYKLAVEAAEEFSTSDWPRFVAGAIGPTTKTLSVTGGISFDELSENFYVQAKALIEGGARFTFTRNEPRYAECKSSNTWYESSI